MDNSSFQLVEQNHSLTNNYNLWKEKLTKVNKTQMINDKDKYIEKYFRIPLREK